MRTAKYRVNTSSLSIGATTFQDLIKDIENVLKGLTSEMESTSLMWEGVARNEFYVTYKEQMEAMTEALKQLAAFAEAMSESRKEYNRCESSVKDKVKSIV